MEEEKFEDCPKAVAEYESEIGVFSVKRNSHSEFFVNSLNNSDNFDVRIPTGVTAPSDAVLLNPDTAILICCSDCEANAASPNDAAAKVI